MTAAETDLEQREEIQVQEKAHEGGHVYPEYVGHFQENDEKSLLWARLVSYQRGHHRRGKIHPSVHRVCVGQRPCDLYDASWGAWFM